jgi:hypothetical protein
MAVMSFFVIHERCYWNIGILEYSTVINMYFFPFFHYSNLPHIKRSMCAIQNHLLREWLFTIMGKGRKDELYIGNKILF